MKKIIRIFCFLILFFNFSYGISILSCDNIEHCKEKIKKDIDYLLKTTFPAESANDFSSPIYNKSISFIHYDEIANSDNLSNLETHYKDIAKFSYYALYNNQVLKIKERFDYEDFVNDPDAYLTLNFKTNKIYAAYSTMIITKKSKIVYVINLDSLGRFHVYKLNNDKEVKEYSFLNSLYTEEFEYIEFGKLVGEIISDCYDNKKGLGWRDEKSGNCMFCAFGATYDPAKKACSNWDCLVIENKMERLNCLCESSGRGAGASVKYFVSGAGTDCAVTCSDGSTISTVSNASVFDSLFSQWVTNYPSDGRIRNATDLCTVDHKIDVVIDVTDDEAGEGGEQGGGETGGGNTSDEGGGTTGGGTTSGGETGGGNDQGNTPTGDNEQSQTPTSSGEQIDFTDPTTGEISKVDVTKNDDGSITFTDPMTNTTAKLDIEQKKITVTDPLVDVTKDSPIVINDDGSITYKDPFTGEEKTIKIGEGQGQGEQGQGEQGQEEGQGEQGEGKEQGEGQEQGKDDKKEEGECEGENCSFNGGEIAIGELGKFDGDGALNAADNAAGTAIDNLYNFAKNSGEEAIGLIDNSKQSFDNFKENVESIKDNPFSSRSVSSCSLSFEAFDNSYKIDICEYTSRFHDLFYSLFFVVLNIFLAFKALQLLVILMAAI